MAISTSYTFSPTVDQILRMALQYAGQLPLGREPSATMLAHARTMMDAYLKSMAKRKLTQMELTTLALGVGDDDYVLPADTIEVEFPMMIKDADDVSETQVWQMTYPMYQEIPHKEQAGTPIRCYPEKTDVVTLRFWPVPDRAFTVSYRRQRLIRNAESGTTLDLTQRWFRALSYRMAHDMALASSRELTLVDYLDKKATELESDAQGTETDGGNIQFVMEDF